MSRRNVNTLLVQTFMQENNVLLRYAELIGPACQSELRRQNRPSGQYHSESHWNGRAKASRQGRTRQAGTGEG